MGRTKKEIDAQEIQYQWVCAYKTSTRPYIQAYRDKKTTNANWVNMYK